MSFRIGFAGLLAMAVLSAVAASVKVGEMTLPTYMFSDPDPVPKTSSDCYPYFRYDGYTANPTPKTWKTVTLESDRLRVVVTPEVGGKIWGRTTSGQALTSYTSTMWRSFGTFPCEAHGRRAA